MACIKSISKAFCFQEVDHLLSIFISFVYISKEDIVYCKECRNKYSPFSILRSKFPSPVRHLYDPAATFFKFRSMARTIEAFSARSSCFSHPLSDIISTESFRISTFIMLAYLFCLLSYFFNLFGSDEVLVCVVSIKIDFYFSGISINIKGILGAYSVSVDDKILEYLTLFL